MRRSGKTTRLIDQAVQTLFQKRELYLCSFHNDKSDLLDPDSAPGNHAQRNFVDRLLDRLSIEHNESCYKIKKQGDFVLITLKP
mgnify:CR=1 FL=1